MLENIKKGQKKNHPDVVHAMSMVIQILYVIHLNDCLCICIFFVVELFTHVLTLHLYLQHIKKNSYIRKHFMNLQFLKEYNHAFNIALLYKLILK